MFFRPQPTKNSRTTTMTPRNRKRRNDNINKDDQTNDRRKDENGTKKKIRTASRGVLAGLTLAVSTLKSEEHGTNKKESEANNSHGRSNDSSLSSYHEVCDFCKDLGAAVMSQVCKRTDMLVSTETAAANATQRIRKAIKKGKPIVSVEWLKECRSQQKRVDIEAFRLESVVQETMQKRTENRNDDEDSPIDTENNISKKKVKKKKDKKKKKRRESGENPSSSSSSSVAEDGSYAARTIDLGCCCVCHELGTDKDCEWCVECPVRLQQKQGCV